MVQIKSAGGRRHGARSGVCFGRWVALIFPTADIHTYCTTARHFPRCVDSSLVVEGHLNGEVLSTDPVPQSASLLQVQTELAWEMEPKALQQHRLHRTPIKLKVCGWPGFKECVYNYNVFGACKPLCSVSEWIMQPTPTSLLAMFLWTYEQLTEGNRFSCSLYMSPFVVWSPTCTLCAGCFTMAQSAKYVLQGAIPRAAPVS